MSPLLGPLLRVEHRADLLGLPEQKLALLYHALFGIGPNVSRHSDKVSVITNDSIKIVFLPQVAFASHDLINPIHGNSFPNFNFFGERGFVVERGER